MRNLPGMLAEEMELAVAHLQAGRYEQAIGLLEKLRRAGVAEPACLNLLGMAYAGAGRHKEARKFFAKAIALKADFAQAHSNLGTALKHLGKSKEAEASYRRAAALAPDSPEVLYNLANFLMDAGRPHEAVAQYRRALELLPGHPAALNNLGRALAQAGAFEEAERTFLQALNVDPDLLEARHNLGNVLLRLQRLEEGVHHFSAALERDSTLVETRLDLGTALHLLGRYDEAERRYREILELAPAYVPVHFNLGNTLAALGRWNEAVSSYERAVSLEPDNAAARWSLAMAQLPVVYQTDAEIEERRAAFAGALGRLGAWIEARPSVDGAAVLVQQPFYLAYQPANNRELMGEFGGLCACLMQRWKDRQSFAAAAPRSSGRIRIGIVSNHIRAHSVWTAITKGWLQELDARFEFHLFHLGDRADGETDFARSRATRFVHGLGSLHEWTGAILAQPLDVLAYPEVGMDLLTTRLAAMRLARVQLASWGHPQTTGLPTIDYFVSAQDMEPPDAQEHYSERLVRLPNLGCFYEPPPLASRTPGRAALGIPEAPLLVCAGSSFKYLPRHDAVLVEIARRLPERRLVFFSDVVPAFSRLLRARLQRAFADAGLRLEDHAVFVARQAPEQFFGVLEEADLMLDTIGFSGFNTAMQAVQCGLPIVTKEGDYLRARFASGILRRMQLPQLVARSDQEYVDLAVQLGRDAGLRGRFKADLQARRGVLYHDKEPLRALRDFFTGLA